MGPDEIERSLGIGPAEHRETVIDAELVSPRKLKLITTASLILSMGAVATAAWFAGKATTVPSPIHMESEDPPALVLPDDLVRLDALVALESSIDERDQTYRVLFETSQDRLVNLENRAKQLETALSALLPLIASTMATGDTTPPAQVSTQPATTSAPATPKPPAATAAPPIAKAPENPGRTPTAARPPPPPPPRPVPVVAHPLMAPSPQNHSIDETSLPLVVIGKVESGLSFKSETEITDATGKTFRIGQSAAGLDGRILRISPDEGLIITDRRIYVIN